MKSVGVFLLLGLLTIWTELPDACGKRQVKTGTCPPDNIRCIRAEPDECLKDFECRENQKCCHYWCALRCVNPAKETPGTCPDVTIVCPVENPPNGCEKDSKCPENKKCCDTGCGKHCVWPVNAPGFPDRPGVRRTVLIQIPASWTLQIPAGCTEELERNLWHGYK